LSRTNRATHERREREAAFRESLLLDAAEAVFLQKGFAGAPVEEIARRAGVALATLYKSFPSKEEAFARVVSRQVAAFHAWIRERTSAGTPAQRLEAVVFRTLEYFEEHEKSFRLYFVPQGLPWNIRSELGEETFRKYLGYQDYVEELCRTTCSAAKKPTAHLRAIAIVGTLNNVIVDGFSTSAGRPPLRKRAPEVWAILKPVALGK
jgi:AcrR family transcriptional regulator